MLRRRPSVSFVIVCIFLDALCIGLIIPVLPRLLGALTASREEQMMWYAAVMVSYGLAQCCFSSLIGALSDRLGRRPVLLAGIGGLGLLSLVPAFTSDPLYILLSRLVGGAMSANVVVAQAYIADITPADRRVREFGKIGAVFGIAYVLGPAVGGLLGDISLRLPFWAAFGVCTLNALYGFVFLAESRGPDRPAPVSHATYPWTAFAKLAGRREVLAPLITLVLFTLSQSIVQVTWALYAEYRFNWSTSQIGLSMFALGLSICATQALILPKLLKTATPRTVLFVGLVVGAVSLAGLGLAPTPAVAVAFLCFSAVAGVVGPVIQGVVSRISAPHEQGVNLGVLSSVNSLTRGLCPLLATPLLVHAASGDPMTAMTGLPYLLCATLLVLACVVMVNRALPDKADEDMMVTFDDSLS